MDPKKLPDWRIHAAVEVAADSPLPGGGSAKAGDVGIVVAPTHSSSHGEVVIPVASPYRLALSIAIRASHEAQRIWKEVAFTPVSPAKRFRPLDYRTAPQLFDYFEQSMISATFSFQALEAFANQAIDERIEEGHTYTLERRKGPQTFESASLQREVSTEEKVATVLPDLFGVETPKAKKLWPRFLALKRVRDATIHLKTADHYVRGAVDKQTLFYQLLNHNARQFPRTSIDLMSHFNEGHPPMWLTHAQQQLDHPA